MANDSSADSIYSENYYDVLGCHRNASFDEIKEAYQRLVRLNHPDKLSTQNESHHNLTSKFLQIQEAWDTLRDRYLRSIYDAKITSNEYNNSLLYDTVKISEMDAQDESEYSYPCRCGGLYRVIVKTEDIGKNLLIPCDECSFSISVLTSDAPHA